MRILSGVLEIVRYWLSPFFADLTNNVALVFEEDLLLSRAFQPPSQDKTGVDKFADKKDKEQEVKQYPFHKKPVVRGKHGHQTLFGR